MAQLESPIGQCGHANTLHPSKNLPNSCGSQTRGPWLRWLCRLAFLLAFAACWQCTLSARDVFVVLSGGDSPLANHYSQYLQAKAAATYFERNYPRDSVWAFFGAGNIEGEPPFFGDVHRRVTRDGIVLDSWLPGPVSRNRPARRDVILRAFREEILPAVAGGGTLYLFVGDHGSRTRGENPESIIDLWSLEPDPASERGWRSTRNESLGVAELRATLAQGIGQGRVVFCMTQCHSGGFHYLVVPREMTPNPKWFTVFPDWAAKIKEQPAFPRAAGFTATDELSLASGCDADPDPDKWAGYERFIPESLFGLDLFTLERTGQGMRSFAEAHVAATLVDRTIDKPYSTSEHYLERWANLIETRLAKETNLTEKVKKQVTVYLRTVDGAAPKASDRAFQQRQTLFRRFTNKLAEQNPAVKSLLRTGTRKELEQAIGPASGRGRGPAPSSSTQGTQNTTPGQSGQKRGSGGQPGRGQPPPQGRRGRGGASPEMLKHWTETVRPAWKTAVESSQVNEVLAGALEFEKYLLSEEAKGRDYFFTRPPTLEIFWRSGYSDPQTLDPAKAEAIVKWSIERRRQIVAWAKTSQDAPVRSAAEKLAPATPQRRSEPTPSPQPPSPASAKSSNVSTRPLSKKTAAERVLFYRRVLAAWEFLIAVNERPALARLRELTELERTPLPRPKS
jgi:hypothetical protein